VCLLIETATDVGFGRGSLADPGGGNPAAPHPVSQWELSSQAAKDLP